MSRSRLVPHSELETRYPNSRLACQVAIEPVLKGAQLIYVGDN